MSNQGNKLSITLKLGRWVMPINVPPEEEYTYRQAEKLMKDRYAFYANGYRDQGEDMHLVMTLFDLAMTCKRQEMNLSVQPILNRLSPLLDDVESALVSTNQMKK